MVFNIILAIIIFAAWVYYLCWSWKVIKDSGDCPECDSKNIRWESRSMTAWRSGNRCLDCGCVFDIYDPANGYGGGRCEIVKHGNWKKRNKTPRRKH